MINRQANIEHILSIPTTDNIPIVVKQYRYPSIHKEEIKQQINKLLEQDIIQPSLSAFNFPLWIESKKLDANGNKQWRLVINFCKLNDKTFGDLYPLPNSRYFRSIRKI